MTDAGSLSIAMTGGAGNVGTALRRILSPQLKRIRIVDLAEPAELAGNESFRRADMSNLDELTKAVEGVDAIVHLAGLRGEAPLADILHINVLGASNLYEAARLAQVPRIVLGSSNHAVGFYPREQVIGSDVPMRPDGLYGLSKCWAELVAGLYYDKVGIKSLLIRIGNAQERPTTPRSLEIWTSPGDLAQLTLIGLTHPDVTCTTVYGVSAGGGSWWDNSTAERLGYVPRDRIVDFASPEAFTPQATELPEIAEQFQGGPFCTWGHDGVRRQR
jgi:uronate dehydrogenase